jgi:hypothetical protein
MPQHHPNKGLDTLVRIYTFYPSAVNEGDCLTSSSGEFTPWGRNPAYQCEWFPKPLWIWCRRQNFLAVFRTADSHSRKVFSISQEYSGVRYNERMLKRKVFIVKSGCYNEHRCQNKHGGILFMMESSIIVFTRERLFTLFIWVKLFMLFIRESLFIDFTKEIYMYGV